MLRGFQITILIFASFALFGCVSRNVNAVNEGQQVYVVDDTGKPISGATVEPFRILDDMKSTQPDVIGWPGDRVVYYPKVTTDTTGHATISVRPVHPVPNAFVTMSGSNWTHNVALSPSGMTTITLSQ